MKKVQLLIIDDHEAVRKALATRLRSTSTIDVVATVQGGGWPLLEKYLPVDVAVYGLKSSSDVDLDSNIALVEQLTQAGTAVIVLTSYADDIERELLLKSGAHRYLLKTINSHQLIAEILEVVAEMARSMPQSKPL